MSVRHSLINSHPDVYIIIIIIIWVKPLPFALMSLVDQKLTRKPIPLTVECWNWLLLLFFFFNVYYTPVGVDRLQLRTSWARDRNQTVLHIILVVEARHSKPSHSSPNRKQAKWGEWGLRGDRNEQWRASGEMGANDAFDYRSVKASGRAAYAMQTSVKEHWSQMTLSTNWLIVANPSNVNKSK